MPRARRSCPRSWIERTHSSCTTSLAEPALVFGHFFEFERRFEAGKVERAQAPPLAAQELALAATRVAIVVIGLYVSQQTLAFTQDSAIEPLGGSSVDVRDETYELVIAGGSARGSRAPCQLLAHLCRAVEHTRSQRPGIEKGRRGGRLSQLSLSPDLDALGSLRPRERIRRRRVRPFRACLRRRSRRERGSRPSSCRSELLRGGVRVPRRSRERLLLCVDSERFKLLLRERVDKLVHGGPSTVGARLGGIDLRSRRRLRGRPWRLLLRLLLLGVRRRSFGSAGNGVPVCGAGWHRSFTRHGAALRRQNSPARSRAEARNAKRFKRTKRGRD